MKVKNDKQVSVVLYFLPFSSKGKEIQGDKFVIDENLILTKNQSEARYFRNPVRSDIKKCLDNLSIYSLFKKSNYDGGLSIKSFKTEIIRNEQKEIVSKKACETNLSEILKVLNIAVYRFDDDNQFLVLQCMFDDPEKEHGYDIEKVVKTHAHFVNNYFKSSNDFVIEESDTKFDIFEDASHQSAFIQLCYKKDGKEYQYNIQDKTNNSISKQDGITFKFDSYHIRYLIQTALFDQEYDKKLFVKQMSAGTLNPMLKYDDGEIFETNKMISLTTNFGSSLLYWREKNESEEAWNTRNDISVKLFYNELVYDFIVAMNYHIRVEKQIEQLGCVNYDAKDSHDYRTILNAQKKYKRDTALYYFLNVSQFDYVNKWYHSLVRGFNTDELDDELEIKFQNSIDYLDEKMNNLAKKENRFIIGVLSIVAVAANVGLFIMAMLEAADALNA